MHILHLLLHFLLLCDILIQDLNGYTQGDRYMFNKQIGDSISEVSHKRIEHPHRSIYFNHIHSHCELLLFIEGEADYNIDGQVFSPVPFDLLFIPGATYHYLMPKTSEPYENYVIGVSPSFIADEHYTKLFSPPLMINIKEDAELKGFFQRLDSYHTAFSAEDFAKCAEALIRELLTYCSYRKDDLRSVHSGSVPYMDEIISHIARNIERPLDAEEIARHFLLSKSYVQNMFSQNMHIGIKKYIMQKKIYAAHADLEQGLSPSEVCEKYAFGDYSVFYRLYKKTFSASPRNKK